MHDETTFQELMQRYNRELLHMQKKAKMPEAAGNLPTPRPVRKPPAAVEEPREETCVPLKSDSAPVPASSGIPEAQPEPAATTVPAPVLPARNENQIRQESIGGAESGEERKKDSGLHSLSLGEDGPALLQDSMLHETLELFVNSTARPRAVHAKGWGALGYFQPYRSMKEHTCAAFLNNPSKKTAALVRFSQAGSAKGSPDTARDVRGFATKFYTDEGICDIVGNHIPVFFVRDAIRFPEAIAALRPSPVSNLPEPERFWSFIARTPEAVHMITWLYSDLGTVDSYRTIRGFGVNTFVWKNADGARKYVKYHWLPLAGERCITRQEAVTLAGTNPNIAGEDLRRALENGTVEYELCVQLMDPSDAPKLPYDPLDDTKAWSEQDYPLLPVGKMTLNRNPDDYENQVEKAAFSPANLVEGIELSADKMLQGRSFIYWDAQRRRLGPDFRNIPVNHQSGWTTKKLVSSGEGERLCGVVQRGEISRTDHFTQAGERYRCMTEEQKEHLADNIASELHLVSDRIKEKVLSYFAKACQEFADRVSERMNDYCQEEGQTD